MNNHIDRTAAIAFVAQRTAKASEDPLLARWTGPYGGVPPWDQLAADAFPGAFATGLSLLAAEIDLIARNPEPATFANTLVPLEDAGRHVARAAILFGVMMSSLNAPAVQTVAREWQPQLTAAYDQIKFNSQLFARLTAIHAARASSGLSAEQQRLVETTYDRFVRGGANLTAAQKDRLGNINRDLAVLFTDFSNKVLADENSWVVLDSFEDLAGLPNALRVAYQAAAAERQLLGTWAVVNTRSSVDAFLTSSTRRDLRERVWKAFKKRGDNGGPNDTNSTISHIVMLRAERAALLGYPSHAHLSMADSMAVDPEKAKQLMLQVWPAAVARVAEEVADMQDIANREGANFNIEAWDYLYYAEKVRKAKYDLDESQVKPYFELNNMIAASFFMAEQLYGLRFTEITGRVPGFHPDVRIWEVTDRESAFVGLFYGDYFARTEKSSGAWAQCYQIHETFTGTVRTPIVSNNNNFVRGGPGEPVLISLDDAETLFHEFGHGLHALLSKVNYPGLDATPNDFVEYPSQVHEQWVLSRPILDRFAKHYQTGAAMPQELVAKIEASSKFNTGYATVEYLSAAIVDMALHMTPDRVVDPSAFERTILQANGAPPQVAMRHRLPQFGHLFSGDFYSAGYYSYLWAEVMDADTRQAFAETGNVFDKVTADKLRTYILAPGNSTDRAEAYRQFRGRDPDVKALLNKRGFPNPY